MSAKWRNTELGTFEVVDHQEPGVRLFGGVLLLVAGQFLYWLAPWFVELAGSGTLGYALASLPGVLVTLFMASLFGVPGAYMALRTRRTVCNKGDWSIRHVTSYGVCWRTREVKSSDVVCVHVISRPRGRNRIGNQRYVVPIHTVEIEAAVPPRIEVAEFTKLGSALELGRQLAGYVETKFGQELR
jgi:hypothetical protein